MTKVEEWQKEIQELIKERQSFKYKNRAIAARLKKLRSYILIYKKRNETNIL